MPTVAGVQTNYVLDLNSSLAQVLSQTTNSVTTRYLLGMDVLGQQQGTQWSYFGYDGLGSVRQLTDANGYIYSVQVPATRPATDYTARVIPQHGGVAVPLEAAQILW